MFRRRKQTAAGSAPSAPSTRPVGTVHLWNNSITGAFCSPPVLDFGSALGEHYRGSSDLSRVTCAECLEIADELALPLDELPPNDFVHLRSALQRPWCGTQLSAQLDPDGVGIWPESHLPKLELRRFDEGFQLVKNSPRSSPEASFDQVTCPACLDKATRLGVVWREQRFPNGASQLLASDESVVEFLRFYLDETAPQPSGTKVFEEHQGTLILTDRRVFFYRDRDKESLFLEFPVSDIRSVVSEPDGAHHRMRIDTVSRLVSGKSFGEATSRVQKFVESVKAAAATAPTSTLDASEVSGRLRELFDLLTEGALTVEEYDNLKAELLRPWQPDRP